MSNDQAHALLALAASTRSPFIVQRCIREVIQERELQTKPYRSIQPKIDTHLSSMWQSHNSIYGVCDLHVDLAYNDELRVSGWWARRKLRKIETQWKVGLWLALTNEAEFFIENQGIRDLKAQAN